MGGWGVAVGADPFSKCHFPPRKHFLVCACVCVCVCVCARACVPPLLGVTFEFGGPTPPTLACAALRQYETCCTVLYRGGGGLYKLEFLQFKFCTKILYAVCSVFLRICAGNNSKRPLFLMSNNWEPFIICSLIFKKWHRFCRARICRFIFSPIRNPPPPPPRVVPCGSKSDCRCSASPPRAHRSVPVLVLCDCAKVEKARCVVGCAA